MATKVCRKCSEEKDLKSCFYVHKQMGDGHLNICTACVRARVSAHREKNIEKIRECDRQRGLRIYDQAKYDARAIANKAIKRGELVRGPCEECGIKGPTDAHHTDYSKPLDVTWLCEPCHGKAHRKYD